jgi:hypothetical protein
LVPREINYTADLPSWHERLAPQVGFEALQMRGGREKKKKVAEVAQCNKEPPPSRQD